MVPKTTHVQEESEYKTSDVDLEPGAYLAVNALAFNAVPASGNTTRDIVEEERRFRWVYASDTMHRLSSAWR